jgi:Ni/Co efflux regulator RcnB
MRKSILLAALAIAVLFAPVTFAKGGKKQQNPKEKTAKVEKKETKTEQKVAHNSKKHSHKKAKKAA